MSSAIVVGVAALIMVVAASWSPALSPQLNEAQNNDYDMSCFVPPSERNDTEQLVSVAIYYPPLESEELKREFQDYQVLSVPNGTCGVDVYYCNFNLYLDAEFKTFIEQTSRDAQEYCEVSPETEWFAKVLTTGMSGPYSSVKLVPDDELSHLPSEWLRGLIVFVHLDYIPSAQPTTVRCNAPLLRSSPHTQYNLNFTFQLNGCPSGRYGGLCDQTCSCVEGVECHSFNGACMCPPGLVGTHCEYTAPRLSVQHQQVYVPFETSYNLTCIADGMIPTNYSWIKDSTSTPLPTESRKKTVPYQPSPVILTSTVEAYNTTVNGHYICEVYNANGAVYRQYVNVTVIAVPDPFLQVPQNRTALVGRSVVFACKTKKEAGTIKWIKGQNPPSLEIENEVGRYGVLYPSDGVSELHIYGVEFSDEDVYRCYVGYTFQAPDLNYAEATLIVQSVPRLICSFQDVVDAASGQEVTLSCQMKEVKPAPSITWLIEGSEVIRNPTTVTTPSDDQYSFDVTTSITFVPAPEDNGRRVYVFLESAAWEGMKGESTSLNVKYKPIVEISPDPISLASGQDADISCMAKGNPHLTNYTWILSRPNEPPKVDSLTGDIYHLKNVDVTYDLASLTCRVNNDIGDTNATVKMEVQENGFTVATISAFAVSGGICLLLLVFSSVFAYRFRKEVILWWSAKTGKNKSDKDFDVFISYKSGTSGEEFVVHELIPRLEQDGYRVCVHYRFFLPGRSIIDNISDAVRRSRKILLLLTPGFVESEWCRYEFQSALLQMLRRQLDIIPVIFEDLDNPENLSEDLKTVLRTLSYITWPNAVLDGRGPQRDADREQFWKLLWRSLPVNPMGLEEPVIIEPVGAQTAQ